MTRPATRHGRAAAAARGPAVTVALLGGMIVVAPWIGLGRAPLIAALVPARGAITAGLAITAVTAGLLLAVAPRRRRVIRPLAAVLTVLTIVSGAVVGFRGLDAGLTDSPEASIRVFEWNTNGGLVSADVIANAAAVAHADVIVLPDGADAADGVVGVLRRHGTPMRLFRAGSGAQVVVLMRTDLAHGYTERPGPDPDRTLVLTAAGRPTVVAVHASQPLSSGLRSWRRDLDWIASECRPGRAVMVSGDLNTSVDAFTATRRLGSCTDAASEVDAAGIGTWPTSLPPVLGMPLDHTLVTSSTGHAASWTVIRSEDRSGALHRPTLTTIAPA
ncbi:endonuclease/exonuclease/phosphatase family protein [Curtobacterium sp. VKM Ac-2922]|uniref:endonuclease/exonuclease/phosphatase family protein n=1 Tax=Curtobacterium sp. VKM Ac-2922 TaxID=2929475 RepID=UPI001FB2C380|nr:endonuclease/exonuclease/phosphatase family protein [Curtobacterium sp. VKM Ac-2922]MCJ1714961.1 hypothetical protein [Curtobacterium sp. VKM Ac-2922]